MSTWKRLIAKPAGSMPGGGLTQWAVGLGTLLMAALFMFWPYFGGNGEVETPTARQGRQPAGPDMQDQVSGQVQEESLRQQQLDDARDRLDRQQRDASNVAGGRITALDLFDPPAPGDGAGPGQPATEAELELREALRLEEIERWRRSIRSQPLARSYRATRPAALSPAAEPATNQAAPTASKPGPGIHAAADQMNQTLASVQQSLAGLQTEAAAAGQPLPAEPVPGAPVTASAPAAPPTTAAANNDYTDPVKVSQPSDPPGWERIYEGSFLEAVLVTQLSGDFPGPVPAMISVPFYSADRQHILVPRGAKVLGTASAVANQDQTRLAVGFHRLLFPDGRWVSLEFQGLNQVGEGALKDRVNRHYVSMFTAVGAIGVLSGLTLQGSNPYAGGAAGFRAGAGQGLAQSATQILQRFLNRLPTITIRAGHRLRVWFTSDVLVPRPQGA